MPVERHALGEAPRELLDLSRREALGEPRVQPPAQRADGAGMDVRDARVHPGPEQEVREVDDDALVERKSGADRECVVVGQGAELELRDRFELRRRQPRRLCQRRVLCESVRAARERGDDEDAELELARRDRTRALELEELAPDVAKDRRRARHRRPEMPEGRREPLALVPERPQIVGKFVARHVREERHPPIIGVAAESVYTRGLGRLTWISS